MIAKTLQVKVTFQVGFGDIEMPKAVFNELKKLEQEIIDSNDIALGNVSAQAADWLTENIKERDAFEWEYEVESID